MHFRPPEEQNDHKVTCGVRTDALGRVKQLIEAALTAGAVEANVITSGTGGGGVAWAARGCSLRGASAAMRHVQASHMRHRDCRRGGGGAGGAPPNLDPRPLAHPPMRR